MKRFLILFMVLAMACGVWADAKYTTSATSYLVEPFFVIDEDGLYLSDDFDSIWIVQANADSSRTTVLTGSDTYDVGGSYPLTYMYYALAANIKASLGSTPGNYVWWIYANGTDGKHTPWAGTYYVEDSLGVSDSVYVKGGVLDTVRSAENVEAGTITTVTTVTGLSANAYAVIQDTMAMAAATYKADVSALALEASLLDSTAAVNGVWAVAARTITGDSYTPDVNVLSMANGAIADTNIKDDAIDYGTFAATAPTAWWNEGKTGYALSTAGNEAIADSVLKDAASYKATGFSTFDASTDSVLIDYAAVEDTMAAHASTYKATGFSTFDASTDSVLVDYAAIEDTMATHAATYKATSVTVSDKTGFSLANGDLTIAKFGATFDDSILAIVNNRSAIGDTNNTDPTLDSTSLDNIVDLALADYGVSTLTDADKIGINLDVVDGTLDAEEIGSDAITSAKIAANAIGASEIAADAIGASELATDAAQEIQANVWINQDTTNVDSSDIGDWFKNNIAGSGGLTDSSIWVYTQRTLTSLDEDTVVIDIDGITIGTVTEVTEDIQGEVWSEGTRTITGDTYTPDVNVVSAGTDAFDSTDYSLGFWHYVTSYSGVGSTDTSMIKTMLKRWWINKDSISHSIANDSAMFMWLVWQAGDTANYFYTTTDSVYAKGGVIDTARNSEAPSIDYQKIADSTWLAVLSSGYRGIDTTEVIRKLLTDAIERLDVSSDFYDTLTAIIGDAVWEEDLSGHGDPTDAGLALSSVFSATDGSGTDGIESDIADLATDITTVISYTDGDGSDGIDADIATIESYTDGDSTDGIDGMIAVISASVPDSLLEAINMIRLARLAIGWPATSPEWDSLDGNVHNAVDSLLNFYFRSDTLFKQWAYDTLSGGIAATVPDSLFDTLTAIHQAVIAFAGSGSEAETLIVLSSSDSTQISQAMIVVRTLDQSTVEVPGKYTDTNGKAILELGDGVGTDSFYVSATHNNYTFATDTIAVASGGGTDTVWMTVFSPSAPVRSGGCVLYGWTAGITGDTLVGAKFTITPITNNLNWVDSTGIIVSIKTETDLTDANGYFELEVYRSDYLTGQGWNGTATSDTLKYNIELTKSGYGTYKLVNQYITADSTRIGD